MILGYARVSTVQQADDTRSSLETQEAVIRGYAMSKGANKLGIEMFVDAGVSGGTRLRDRPAGADLLRTAKRGDTIIAAKLDRMFRNSTDALVTAEKLKEQGIHLVLFDLGNDPITGDGMAKLVFTIFAALSDAERTRINERTAEGRRAKMARGGAMGNAPFGFRKIGQGRHAVLEMDENEQAIIHKVRKQHSWNFGYEDIARKLVKDGTMSRSGKPFTRGQIYKLIHHPETAQ